MQLKPGTKIQAKVARWPDELIARVEQSAARDDQVANLAASGMAVERVEKWLEIVEREPESPAAQFPLVVLRTSSERGRRAQPSADGLRLGDVDQGSYGVVPEEWALRNDTPRGSKPMRGAYMPGSYSVYEKAEVWADGVADLYEDAIRDRWGPAFDLPWDERETLADELERATGQLCAIYSNHGLIEQKIISRWLERISYGFHEVKLFLATQVFDAGRKVEVLRKRSLAGDGAVGKAPIGDVYRGWYGALSFTELITALNVVYKSYELTAFEAAAEWAASDFDRDLFQRLAGDSQRHLEYGLKHLEWYGRYAERADEALNAFFARGEGHLASELAFSNLEREALTVLFAGGLERLDGGVEKLKGLRQRQLEDYLGRLASVGIDRAPKVTGVLRGLAADPLLVAQQQAAEQAAADRVPQRSS